LCPGGCGRWGEEAGWVTCEGGLGRGGKKKGRGGTAFGIESRRRCKALQRGLWLGVRVGGGRGGREGGCLTWGPIGERDKHVTALCPPWASSCGARASLLGQSRSGGRAWDVGQGGFEAHPRVTRSQASSRTMLHQRSKNRHLSLIQ